MQFSFWGDLLLITNHRGGKNKSLQYWLTHQRVILYFSLDKWAEHKAQCFLSDNGSNFRAV